MASESPGGSRRRFAKRRRAYNAGMTTTSAPPALDSRQRLTLIVDTMREISRQTDPQVIARIYGQRVRQLTPFDRFMAVSRRDLDRPRFRITRSSLWADEVN